MRKTNYVELLVLTLKALDIDSLEQKKRYTIKKKFKNKQFENIQMLNYALKSKKDEIKKKIKSYKKFLTHKNKLFLLFNVSEEYFSFLQYLKKFYYYLPKYQKNNKITENSYILAIKSLLLVEYFLENFQQKN